MARFKVPDEPKKYSYEISSFLGIDTQTDAIDVSSNRSPNCENIIRDYMGSIRKRYGYKTQFSLVGRINGAHLLVTNKTRRLVHAGDKYYHVPEPTEELPDPEYTEIYTSGDNISMAQQLDGKLYMVDGTTYLEYDGKIMKKPDGKIPVIIINRNPTGGGTPLEQINLIQPKRTEKFKGNGTAKDFQLTTTSIDAKTVTVKQLQADGTLKELTEGAGLTVNRELGKVTFTTAPPVTPSTGEDNIFITYAKTTEGYADKINHCTVSTCYGMNGAFDRLILTGNPKYKNQDWFSKSNDFTYFGDLDYSVVGRDDSAIVNYAINNDYLVTLKNNADNSVNSTVRKFELINNAVVLRTTGSIQSLGALSPYAFSHLGTEPMYITVDNKVVAITIADNVAERFSQGRSYYIDKGLEKANLKDSFAVYYNGFYVFTAENDLYLIDEMQPSYQKNTPYSRRQYECFRFPNICARVMWVEDGNLWFGTADGKVKRFMENSWSDDGVPVKSVWETPFIFTDAWNTIKTFTHLYLLLRPAVRTGLKVEAEIDGRWEEIIPYTMDWHYFSFADLDFSKLTFRTSKSPRTNATKINIKKEQYIRLRLVNDKDEPLSIAKLQIMYTILRNVK